MHNSAVRTEELLSPNLQDRPTWLRFSGLGAEITALIAVFMGFGYWIDGKMATEPWGLLIGLFLGLFGSFHRSIRALASIRPPTPSNNSPHTNHGRTSPESGGE